MATAAPQVSASVLKPRRGANLAFGVLRRSRVPSTKLHPIIQAKLRMNAPGDGCEQEADWIADQVGRMPDHLGAETPVATGLASAPPARAEPMCPGCKGSWHHEAPEETRSTSREGPQESTATPIAERAAVESVTRLGGRPLDTRTRQSMEWRTGGDFHDVRVHTGPEADEAAKLFRARAFTVEKDVVFANGEYRPHEANGCHLLAHELTHVLQQGKSSLQGPWLQRQGVDIDEDVDELPVVPGFDPLAEAVRIVRSTASGLAASQLTPDLVQGIERAEQRFLTVARQAAEIVGAGSSCGPTQLTEAAISDIDANMESAVGQFADSFGAAPSDWEAKATHPDWYLFYTAAYLAWCINKADRLFQANDSATGKVNLGIITYLGAFESIRDLRREIAAERGIAKTDVTWSMIEEKAETYSKKLNDDINYVRTARGLADIPYIERERP